MEKTLILLKVDAIERGLAGTILARYENAGFRIEECRFFQPDLAHWERHYEELKERNPEAFRRITQYLASKPVVAVIFRGWNAIKKARVLNGNTDPLMALPGTIRGDFSSDSVALGNLEHRPLFNLVHAADSPESARKEIEIWFPGHFVPKNL
jgi:nucleoside-diphosphate kinase